MNSPGPAARALALLVLLAATACGPGGAATDRRAVDISPRHQARPLRSADLLELLDAEKGRVVLLVHWNSTCRPCGLTFDEADQLQKVMGRYGVRVIGVVLDRPEKAAAIDAHLARRRPTFPNIFLLDRDPTPYTRRIDPDWDGDLPATFVFDREGNRVASFRRFVSEKELVQRIWPLVTK